MSNPFIYRIEGGVLYRDCKLDSSLSRNDEIDDHTLSDYLNKKENTIWELRENYRRVNDELLHITARLKELVE